RTPRRPFTRTWRARLRRSPTSNISTTMRASNACCSMARRNSKTVVCVRIRRPRVWASRSNTPMLSSGGSPKQHQRAHEGALVSIVEQPRAAASPVSRHTPRAQLEAELRRLNAEVRFDDGSRALYATDASNYRQVPIGVVLPRDVDAMVETVAV